jgi:hypothetical protein
MLRIREIVDGRGEPTLRLVDLSAVTFVDRRGVVALRWLTTEGVAIFGGVHRRTAQRRR